MGFSSMLGGDGGTGQFDDYEEFVPANIPDPGWFLDGHNVLTGEDHVDVHLITKELFEERGVYDMTFGYNLARLNLDQRHRNAGYRYAEESDSEGVLRAEFTPTTPFCPQSDTLTKGSFRAWNGLSDRHEYDIVRVRVDDMHHRSDEINAALKELEMEYREDGTVTNVSEEGRSDEATGTGGCGAGGGDTASRGYGPDAPF